MARPRPATVKDLHECGAALPEVKRDAAEQASPERPRYSVQGKRFVVFRAPRKDAVDPATSAPFPEGVALCCSATDKEALASDFPAQHVDGRDPRV